MATSDVMGSSGLIRSLKPTIPATTLTLRKTFKTPGMFSQTLRQRASIIIYQKNMIASRKDQNVKKI
jgi:hypothetical protein